MIKKKTKETHTVAYCVDGVPLKPSLAQAPSLSKPIRQTYRVHQIATVDWQLALWLLRQLPHNLNPRLRPAAQSPRRSVQIHKAHISRAPLLPNPDLVSIVRPSSLVQAAQRKLPTCRGSHWVVLNVVMAETV